MKGLSITIFFYIFQLFLNYYYRPEYILQTLNSFQDNQNFFNFTINMLSKTFEDAYAFNEIAKNPPNPEFSKDYFKKVNITNVLKEINTKDKTIYKLYQNLKKAFFELEDRHIDLNLRTYVSIFTQTFMNHPLKL